MTTECNVRHRSLGRRVWDTAGSWLILLVVIFVTWNASTEWNDMKHRNNLSIIMNAGLKEREGLRLQLKELSNYNYELTHTIGQMGEAIPATINKANATLNRVEETINRVNSALPDEDKKE